MIAANGTDCAWATLSRVGDHQLHYPHYAARRLKVKAWRKSPGSCSAAAGGNPARAATASKSTVLRAGHSRYVVVK